MEAGKQLETKLVFEKPFQSEADTYMDVVPADDGTRVTWGFTSKFPYPMNLMLLFGWVEKSIGKDYEKGLATLKTIVEEEEAAN